MNYLRHTLLSLTVAISVFAAEPSADRKPLLDHLNQSETEFAAAIRGLTPEQWNFKPAGGGWSIAECAEHIILAEDLLRGLVSGLLEKPAQPRSGAATPDAKVLAMITDRSFKAKAPEQLHPTRKFADAESAIRGYRETRAKTVAMVESTPDLRSHSQVHPGIKDMVMDAHQWLLYTSGHSLRHTAQINEVKSSPGFPRGR